MLLRNSLALLISLSAVSALASEPPSSLDPDNSRGQVEIEHQHQRVAQCVAKRDGKQLSCKATYQNADTATLVNLRPLPDAKAVSSTDKRREVNLTFESKLGTQTKSAELGAGVWELAWPGSTQLARFVVAPGAHFKLALKTVSGRCQPKRASCVRLTTPRSRTISVPPDRRAP